MKHYKGTKMFSCIAVVFSILLLIFLCIYPSVKTKQIVDTIVGLADDCLQAIKDDKTPIVEEKISQINDILSDKSQMMKMFYFHDDIADLENAAHRAVKMLYVLGEDMELLASSVCDIRECAEHIIERDGLDWGSFI